MSEGPVFYALPKGKQKVRLRNLNPFSMQYQQKTESGNLESKPVFYDPSKGRWETHWGTLKFLQVTHTYEMKIGT